MRRRRGGLAALVLGATVLSITIPALSGSPTVVEDWTRQPVGATGVPALWSPYATMGGRARYDFAVADMDGRRALRLRSRDEHSNIAREVRVDLRTTPVLEWSWKVVQLPEGADVRRRETSDLTAHVIVVWPRMPAMLRSRLIAYAWDTSAPAPSVERSRKTGMVTFFILHSGPAETGRWITERRNVREDYRRVFGEEPDDPGAVVLSIDTNDTRSTAEAFIGRIAFTAADPAGR